MVRLTLKLYGTDGKDTAEYSTHLSIDAALQYSRERAALSAGTRVGDLATVAIVIDNNVSLAEVG